MLLLASKRQRSSEKSLFFFGDEINDLLDVDGLDSFESIFLKLTPFNSGQAIDHCNEMIPARYLYVVKRKFEYSQNRKKIICHFVPYFRGGDYNSLMLKVPCGIFSFRLCCMLEVIKYQ